ncbi:MAG TPA: T9SS type A sorting domain-containing protein [Candidatus Acidoferrales bacterium]|nr:T9SS type A sorting domain-containing protein [Candidatus Acidoferrales bacterium]
MIEVLFAATDIQKMFKPTKRRFLVLLLTVMALGSTSAWSATISSTGTGGNWNAAGTWVGGVAPGNTDSVVIVSGATVTVNGANRTCGSINILGTLQWSAAGGSRTLTVSGGGTGSGTIGGNGIIIVANAAVTGTITMSAGTNSNWIFSGTITRTGALVVNMTSTTDQTITGVLICNTFTVNKAGGTLHLSITPTVTTTTTLTAGSIDYNSGGTQSILNANHPADLSLSNSGTNLTTTAALTIGGNLIVADGTTFTSNAAYALTVTGTTTVGGGTSGTLAISTASTNTQTFTGAVTVNSGASFTESIAASLAFGSDLSVNGTLTENGAAPVTVAGNFTNNGSYTASTGTHTFSGTAKTIGGTSGISIASLAVTGTYTNNGTLTVSTALTGAGGLTNGLSSVLNIGGTSTITTLTATAVGNMVNYNGAAQTVKVVAYNNLTLSGSGVKTFAVTTINGNLTLSGTATAAMGASLAIGGNLSIGDGTTFTVGAYTITVTGTTTLGGGASGTLSITSMTGTKTFSRAVTINSGASFTESVAEAIAFGSDVTINGTLTENGNAAIGIAGNFTDNGTYTASTGFHTFSGTGMAIGGSSAISIPSVTISGSYANNGTLTVTTALAGTGGLTNADTLNINFAGAAGIASLTATTPGNTVNYGYAGAQTVISTNYYNLTLGGSGAKTLQAGTTSIAGSFTLSGTATTTGVIGLTIGGSIVLGSGTAFTAGAFIHSIAGSWVNNGGTFTSTGSTIGFNGSAAQTIGGTSASAFNNLSINNSNGVSLGASVSIAGTLTLTSGIVTTSATNLLTITNTSAGSISGASSASFVSGPLAITLPANVGADGTTYTFPVGETANYRPISLMNIRTGATSPVVRATVNGSGATTGDGTTITSIAPRNWYVQATSGNFTSATIQLTESGLIPTNVIGQSSAQSGTYASIGGTNVGATVTSVQTVSSFPGYFAIGISTVKPLYSYQSGNWDSTTTWTTDPSGSLWINGKVPGTMDNVVILNGRTISVSSNNKKVVSLNLNAGGVVDIQSTTGHSFGTVTGQGRIMLSSNNFPGGTFTNFVASGGGTIEYYNLNAAGLSTTQLTYNNLIVSNYSTNANSVYLNNFANPATYTVNGNFSLKNYSSGSNTFYFGSPTASDNLVSMTVYGSLSVDAGCNIRVNNFATAHNVPNASDEGATPYPVHTLNLYGNLTNNGSVRFTGLPSPVNNAYYALTTTAYNAVNYGDVQVFFYGATNNTMTCNGTTDFFRIVVAKGLDDTHTLEVSSTNTNNFALYAPNNQGNNAFNGGTNGYGYGVYYKALFIHYGTLKLDANISIPSLTEGGQDFNLVPTAGLWINGANVSTTVSGLNGTGYQAATLYGSLRISAGQFSTGDAAGMVLGTLGTPTITIEGTGVLDASNAWEATGGTNLMSYIQTGGTANFRLQGENHVGPMFGLNNPNSSFVMSGGTINFTNNAFVDGTYDYNVMDLEPQSGYYQVTGGTINISLPSSATAYTVISTVPLNNVNISRGSGAGTTTVQWNTPSPNLSVLNNLVINSNAVLNLSTSSLSLFVGGNFTIASGGAYTPGTTDTTTFNGNGYQAFTNIGTITGGLASLSVTSSSNTTIISNNLTVNGTLAIGRNAMLNDSGKYVYVIGSVVNSGTHTGLSSGGGIRLTGTTAQTINGGGRFYNLIIDKSNTTGVSLLSNITVTGTLRLVTNPNLTIGSYNLTLDSLANVYTDLATGASYDSLHMIVTAGLASDNGVTKKFCSSSTTFLYPIGTGTKYRPAQIQFTSNPYQYGSITVRPVASADPMVQAANQSITFYWKVTSSNFTGIQNNSINEIYYYYPVDVPNSTYESSYVPATFIAPSWMINSAGTVSYTLTPRQIHFNSLNYLDGEYTCGTSAAFAAVPALYSIVSGNWNSTATWSTTRGGPAGSTTPHVTTVVYVTNGTTVTTTLADSSGNLIIEPGATLNLETVTGHSFGTIVNNPASGSGTLRIASSAYFPKGDWGNFLGINGGTVEYYQTAAGTLNLPTTYALPSGSTANITTYCNLTASPYNASNIILPNTNLTIYKNFTAKYSAGGGTANCITQINAGATTTTLEVHGIISVNQYGILQYMNGAAQSVVADSDIIIAAGGALQVSTSGTANLVNTLTLYGNITNNGTLDLDPNYPANDNYNCLLGFAGASSKAFTSTTTPTRTRLYAISVNKGTTLDSMVNVMIDPTGFQMGNGGLSLQNGTFRLTSAVTMALSSGGFTIPVTGGLSVNGGTLNVVTDAISADLTLKGRLEILSGTINVGPSISSTSTISSSILYSAAGSPTISISGGSLNVYSQIRRDTANNSGSLNYTQTAGTVTIGGKNPKALRAAFEVMNSGSRFAMSGGTLILANGSINTISPYDMDIEPDASNVTGGAIQLGLSGTTQTTFRFETSVPLWTVTLDASSNASAIQEVYNSTLLGNLTIGGASGYYNANGLDLEIGGNLVNNNTNAANGINVGGFQAQSTTQTTSFVGSADQTIIGTSSNRTNFANLEIATGSSHTTFLSSGACTMVVNGDLTLTSGTLNDGGNPMYLLGDVDNNAVHVSPNANSGGMIFSGTSNQGMTGSGTGVFGNIEINNSGNGVNMTDNSTINGQIKFTKGYLYIDDYVLTLGPNATVAGTPNASNLILLNGVLSDKGVTKIFPTGASSFTFPIGANGKYTPAAFSFSSNSNSGASIRVIPVDGLQPTINTDSVKNYLKYYWYVSSTGFSSAYSVTHTYTYITTDTAGHPANIERYDNSISKWSTVTGTISPPTFTFTSSSILDGSYTIGDVFASLPMLYSIMSGSWYNGALWSTDTTTKIPYGKIPNGNPVFIRSQDSVALTANNANASSVVINGILDAGNTTLNNIGQVSGSGKIKISSTASGYFAFPGGVYDGFFSNSASTVEFYGTINGRLPLDPGNTTKPYQNVIFSGTSIKYISSVDTKVIGNLTIQNGSKLDNTQYNKDIYILGNWVDNNTGTAGFTPGTGTVYFDGSSAQRITMGSSSTTETFYNFALNNSSGITIATGNVSVSRNLFLTSGNITTSSNNSLTITNTDTGAVVGGGVNSFVNGPLIKQINSGSHFQFPVGDAVSSNRNRFGYVSVNNVSTSGTWTAQFSDKNPTTDGYSISNMTPPLMSVNYTEYWKVAGPTGGTANVTLSWDQYSGMSSSSSTRALSLVAEWGTPVAGSWNSAGSMVSDFGQDSGTVATSTVLNLAGTQVFTIGATTAAIAALITSIQTGLWNNPAVWNVGRIPSAIDTVVITSPYNVVLNIPLAIARFAVNNGGTYNDSTFTLTVAGNVTLNGTWSGSGKLSMTMSGGAIYGTGTVTGKSTLEIAAGSESIVSNANLILKNVSILSADTLNNYGSVTIDSLAGSTATSIFNNFPGSTLTINGSLLNTGTLNAAVSPNTVIYGGSAAQVIKSTTYNNIIISGAGAKTINSGATTISNGTLELQSGPVFTIQSGASVAATGTGKIVLDPNSSYINLSNSAPLVQVQTRITGRDGWRMIAAPDTVTVGSMLGGKFVTQGFSGSTYPAMQPNLMWWDETSKGTSLQAWRAPSNMTDTVKLGRGYMYYVFNGAQITGQSGGGNYSDTLPLTMSALGPEHPLTTAFDFGVTATMRAGGGSPDTTYTDTAAADYGWNLVGNPTPSTINWNASSGWTKTNMDGTIYVWDPNDTTGGYKTWNGTTGNLGSGLIAPFQAFWVKANNANPSLRCDNGVKSSGGVFLEKAVKDSIGNILSAKAAEKSSGNNPLSKVTDDSVSSSTPVISLTLSSNELEAQAYLMFSGSGLLSYDPYDAFSLVPLTNDYLILYSVAGEGQLPMQIQDLPDTGFGEPFTLPLYVGGTMAGKPLSSSFTLCWKLDGKLPSGWNIELMDDDNAKAYNISAEGQLTFQYNTPAGMVPLSNSFLEKTSSNGSSRRSLPTPVVLTVPSSKLSKAASVTPRFRLVIAANNNLNGYLPTTPQLEQNYPNPFNPTTNIPFTVPAKSRVTIEVFNVLGQKVATLADMDYDAGTHVVVWNPRGTASGVYFCRLIAGSHKKTIKMLLLR